MDMYTYIYLNIKEDLFHLQVKLTTELTEATSQISTLQLEVAALRKKEFELQQQLGTTTQDTRKQQEELEQLRTQHKGLLMCLNCFMDNYIKCETCRSSIIHTNQVRRDLA